MEVSYTTNVIMMWCRWLGFAGVRVVEFGHRYYSVAKAYLLVFIVRRLLV